MGNALLQALSEDWSGRADSGLPAWFRERQRRALADALAAAWPARGAEAWKYTSLHALAQRQPRALAAADDALDAAMMAEDLVFVDGHCRAERGVDSVTGVSLRAQSAALAEDDERLRFLISRDSEASDVFELLNIAHADDGAWIHVPGGSGDERWRQLAMRSSTNGADGHWHLSHRIELGEGARLRLCIDLAGAASPALATVFSRIRMQRGARLDLVWINAPNDAMSLIARTRIELESGAILRMQVLDAGAAPSRHDLRIALRGEQAQVELGGVFLLAGRRHADLQLDLRHETANARSQTTWRAIANERSRAVFNGHITVAAGADGSDAQLTCKSLLGSAQAEIDAKPVLEIYADDVKCAHGATVGQLDAQALFYLRTRGIAEPQARALLLRAFAAQALVGLTDSPAQARLMDWLGTDDE